MKRILLPALFLAVFLSGCTSTKGPTPTVEPSPSQPESEERILQATWLEVDGEHRFWVTLTETNEPSPITQSPFFENNDYVGLRVGFANSKVSPPDQSFLTGYRCQPYELQFFIGDWNFDGYQDLAFINMIGGIRYSTFDFYFWEPDKEQFIHDPYGLGQLNNPALHPEAEAITSYSSAAPGSDWYDYYRYVDGELVMARECSYVYDWDTGYCTALVKDGELTMFKATDADSDDWSRYRLWRDDLSYQQRELYGFPIDDTHDVIEVPTGGKLGTVLVTVEIESQNADEYQFSVWSMDNLDEPIQTMTTERVNTFHHAAVVDANFDGYMDFTYQYVLGNSAGSSRLFLWSEARGQFVEEPEFADVPNPDIDQETETISSFATWTNAGDGVESLYHWENGRLVCFYQEEITYPDGDGNQERIVYERVDGKLIEVSREAWEMLG